VRVPDLHAFQRAIASRACTPEVGDVRATAVLVSTHAAAAELRDTLENLVLLAPGGDGRPVVVWPEILTRAGWYERLHHASPAAPRQLSAIEREVLMARAARQAIAAGHVPPFRVRPALVAEMLAFLDAILRLGRTLDAFDRLLVEELEPRVPIDRGAERLLQQTTFLVTAFCEYRNLVAASGALDEHLLREHLLQADTPTAFTRVVVTVGDRSCASDGLWPVDFDLLARLARLEQIDVIATENVLAAGFHERLNDLLPGFEEIDFGQPAALSGRVPVLVTPAGEDMPWWVARDREEEIGSIARRIKGGISSSSGVRSPESGLPLDRMAIICQRPLPYVYLAQSCLGAAGIPFQAFDDLPLAAEPFAAAVDLVFRFVHSGFARKPALALLRSPHFFFGVDDDGREISREAVTALDSALRETSGIAGAETWHRVAALWSGPEATRVQRAAAPAAAALARASAQLEPLRRTQPASAHFDLLLAFLDTHGRTPDEALPLSARTARARAAIVGALRELRAAHRAHDDPPADFDDFVSRIRRWMEAQTFSPRAGRLGVHLVDADTARYGDFDDVHLVGLIEREWPDKAGRTIFYPLTLLNQLGWPPERLRLAGARAAFRDLLRLAGGRVSVSTFVLEDDALVEPSPLLDELGRSGLAVCTEDVPRHLRILPEEALSLEPACLDALAPSAQQWAALRQQRSAFTDARFHGSVGPVAVRTYAVRRLETYLDCPFKYLAESVLGLQDESDDDPAEGPRAQGKFLHEILSAFFEQWQRSGGGAITGENIDAARSMLAALVDTRLAALPPADAVLWRARLLGSPARSGIGEIVFRAEAGVAERVIERLLEYRLDGTCRIESAGSGRDVSLRGIADRVDVLDGNRCRIVDYKLGRAPDVRRAIQLPIYAIQVRRQFDADGRDVTLADAAYLAFGERHPYVRLTSRGSTLDQAVAEGQSRALEAIEGIERGAFPPRPADGFQCSYCPYARVCRKDYVDGQ
jgi:RecB family exonuclease